MEGSRLWKSGLILAVLVAIHAGATLAHQDTASARHNQNAVSQNSKTVATSTSRVNPIPSQARASTALPSQVARSRHAEHLRNVQRMRVAIRIKQEAARQAAAARTAVPVHSASAERETEKEEKKEHGPHLYSVQFAADADPDGLEAPEGDPKKMDYHNGPVMYEPINLYVLWLGSNFTAQQKGLIRTFIASLNPLPAAQAPDPPATQTVTNWWNVNRLYYDDQKRVVTNTIRLKGEYSLPMVPELQWSVEKKAYILTGEQSVVNVLTRLLDAKVFPVDPNGAYTVFSDNKIYQTGVTGNMGAKMCEKYCGWHDSFPYTPKGGQAAADIKYLWVGTATTLCPKSCIPYAMSGGQYVAPSVDQGIHGAISIFAHELAETASDPTGDGWWSDESQEENGDKCQWKYGDTKTFVTPSGQTAIYNLVGMNNEKFLVQGNWDMMTGGCSISRVIKTAKR